MLASYSATENSSASACLLRLSFFRQETFYYQKCGKYYYATVALLYIFIDNTLYISVQDDDNAFPSFPIPPNTLKQRLNCKNLVLLRYCFWTPLVTSECVLVVDAWDQHRADLTSVQKTLHITQEKLLHQTKLCKQQVRLDMRNLLRIQHVRDPRPAFLVARPPPQTSKQRDPGAFPQKIEA